MTKQEILFTKSSDITKNEEGVIELVVEDCVFFHDNKNVNIEKVIILGSKDKNKTIKIKDKSNLNEVLKNNGNFKISFEIDKVKIKLIKPEGTKTCTSKDNVEAEGEQVPLIRINENEKILIINWNPDVIKVAENEATDKNTDNDNSNESPAPNNSESTCQSKVDEINKKLASEGVKSESLTGEVKTSFDKLKNNQVTDNSERDSAEKAINESIYEISAANKLINLTNRINDAIKNKNDLAILEKELDAFISNVNYQSKKTEAKTLKLKIAETKTSNDTSWFVKNWKPILLIPSLIALIIGAVLYFRK